jgi:hypothetical protein
MSRTMSATTLESREVAKTGRLRAAKARGGSTPTQAPSVQARVASMPTKCRKTYVRAMSGRSKAAAIKAFCMECVGWSRREVALCTAPACPLHPYRPFKRVRCPAGAPAREGTS